MLDDPLPDDALRYRHDMTEPMVDRLQTLDILDRLIAFDTVSANANLDLIDYVEDHLRAQGFETHRAPDPSGRKSGLYAVTGPRDRQGILLSAHTDVVPVEGQPWTREPFRMTRENGRVYGRGTTDMKGYLAAMLSLAGRIAGRPLTEPLKFAISYDEEIGCVGIRRMIDRLAPTIGLPRAAFVGEPTQMQIAIGHKGKTFLRATFHGESGHSAMAPNFRNALHPAAEFIGAMRDLQADLVRNGARDDAYEIPYSTVHVAKITGGRALNIVPDLAEIDFEFRNLAGDSAHDLRARIDTAAARIAADFGPGPGARIGIEERNAYPGLETDPGAEVVALAQGLAGQGGTTKVPYGTEAGYFAQALGIPTIVCGPGSMAEQGHKPDESIGEDELAACDAFMDRLAERLCL